MLQKECGDQAETDVIVDTLIDKELAVYVRLRGPDSCSCRRTAHILPTECPILPVYPPSLAHHADVRQSEHPPSLSVDSPRLCDSI